MPPGPTYGDSPVYDVFWSISAWLEASFQDELDPGNAQHEEHARNLVVTLVQQLEAKALESGDFLTKNKLEEIISNIKVRKNTDFWQGMEISWLLKPEIKVSAIFDRNSADFRN